MSGTTELGCVDMIMATDLDLPKTISDRWSLSFYNLEWHPNQDCPSDGPTHTTD